MSVRGGDGGAGHAQRVGESAFTGELSPEGQAAVEDQHADAVGQALVSGSAMTGRAPLAQLAGQKVHIERSGGHFDRHLRPVCAKWLLRSKPVGWNIGT